MIRSLILSGPISKTSIQRRTAPDVSGSDDLIGVRRLAKEPAQKPLEMACGSGRAARFGETAARCQFPQSGRKPNGRFPSDGGERLSITHKFRADRGAQRDVS